MIYIYLYIYIYIYTYVDISKWSVTFLQKEFWQRFLFQLILRLTTLWSFRINQYKVFILVWWLVISVESLGSWRWTENLYFSLTYFLLPIKLEESFWCRSAMVLCLLSLFINEMIALQIVLWNCSTLFCRHAVTQKTKKSFSVKC